MAILSRIPDGLSFRRVVKPGTSRSSLAVMSYAKIYIANFFGTVSKMRIEYCDFENWQQYKYLNIIF